MDSGRISFFPADHAPPVSRRGVTVPELLVNLAERLGHGRATLTPTGRAAMTMLFSHLGLGREDEVFVTEQAAKAGVTYENTSGTEPLVVLRYFGPEVNPEAPGIKYQGDVRL